jgi:hypothetical protein
MHKTHVRHGVDVCIRRTSKAIIIRVYLLPVRVVRLPVFTLFIGAPIFGNETSGTKGPLAFGSSEEPIVTSSKVSGCRFAIMTTSTDNISSFDSLS